MEPDRVADEVGREAVTLSAVTGGRADRYPAIDRTLFELACDEVANLQNRVLMLGCQTLEGKLASFVLEFLGPSSVPSSLCREVELPMRRPDIADYLGLTTESVSRGFSRLRHDRIIALPQPSRIVVRNRMALEALAFWRPGLAQPGGPHRTVKSLAHGG